MTMEETPAAETGSSGQSITFEGGLRPLVGLAGGFAVLATLSVVLGSEIPDGLQPAWEISKFGALAVLGLTVLRVDGVRPTDLGLAPEGLWPAVGIFAGIWVILNLLGIGIATATGIPWGVDVLLDLPADWEMVPAPGVTTVVFQFLVVGFLEELVFRGYLQSKVIALVGDESRSRIGFGIVVASLTFGLVHVPAVVVAGGSPAAVLFVVVARAGTGIAFGVLYELTHNIYYLMLLHGLGNTWVLAVDVNSLPVAGLATFIAGVAVIYPSSALAYRSWMAARDSPVRIRRTDLTVTGTTN